MCGMFDLPERTMRAPENAPENTMRSSTTPWRARLAGAIAGLGLFVGGSDFFGSIDDTRIVFDETFEDDPLGAVPINVYWTASAVIKTPTGLVLDESTANPGKVVVVGSPGDHRVQLSDAGVAQGSGHTAMLCVPVPPCGPKAALARFDLIPIKFDGETIECAMIDNRTTPGTGRMVSLFIDTRGRVRVNGVDTGFSVTVGNTYHVETKVSFEPGPFDKFELTIADAANPQYHWSSGVLPTLDQGNDLTVLAFMTGDVGQGAFQVDDIRLLSIKD